MIQHVSSKVHGNGGMAGELVLCCTRVTNSFAMFLHRTLQLPSGPSFLPKKPLTGRVVPAIFGLHAKGIVPRIARERTTLVMSFQ